MEAKDTVMKPRQIVEAMSEWKDDNGIAWEDWAMVMTTQAEISFSNGLEVGKELGKQLGRKEVIEWGLETCPHDLFGEGTLCFKRACDECWQEQIEKWGL